MNWTLHCGSALEVLRTLPDESVNCIVTSPPYWGLRDYGHDDQIGLERTPDEFVRALVSVFAECRRVLRGDGVLWMNLGDSYASGGNGAGSGKQLTNVGSWMPRKVAPEGLKPKDLVGVPWRVAFALQAAGWYLRADVIWSKPNPMPESVRDRPTKAHEMVFLLTKSARYTYDVDAIREKYAESTLKEFDQPYEAEGRKDYGVAGVQNPSSVKARIVAKARSVREGVDSKGGNQGNGTMTFGGQIGANARSVWAIPTEPSPYEHFAVMPKALARKCIRAGCPPGGTVLDPFAGVSTTGVVALEEGRSFVGIELNPKYHAIGRERLAGVAPLLATEVSA